MGFLDSVQAILAPPNREDPNRVADNQRAYELAIQNVPGALDYLKGRSGRFGLIYVPALPNVRETPGMIGGHATQLAKDDAYAKYTAVLGGTVPPSPNLPQPTALQNEIANLIGNVREDIAETVARVGTGAGAQIIQASGSVAEQIDPATPRAAGALTTGQVTVLVIGAVVLILLFRR